MPWYISVTSNDLFLLKSFEERGVQKIVQDYFLIIISWLVVDYAKTCLKAMSNFKSAWNWNRKSRFISLLKLFEIDTKMDR